LGSLALRFFQHMMPNYAASDFHRFSGEADAREGAAPRQIDGVIIPAKDRRRRICSVQFK